MYPYMKHLMKTPRPVPPILEREYRRARPVEGIGESRVLWREVAILETLRAMMPCRCTSCA